MRKSRGQEHVEFTSDEISLLIFLASGLDPEKYVQAGTRAVLYKAKASTVEDDDSGFTRVRWRLAP